LGLKGLVVVVVVVVVVVHPKRVYTKEMIRIVECTKNNKT
jgi:hypothetical protein